MDYETVVTAGGISMLLMQGLKWIIRKFKKDMTYEFPETFYSIGIPVLNVFTPFAIAFLFNKPMPMPLGGIWEVLRYALLVAIGSLISFLSYEKGLKPLVDYGTKLREKNAGA